MNFRHVDPEGEEQLPKALGDLHRQQKRENATNGMITDLVQEVLSVLSRMSSNLEMSARHVNVVLVLEGVKPKAKAAAKGIVNPLRPRLAVSHQAVVQTRSLVDFILKVNAIKVTSAIFITSLSANSLRVDLAKTAQSVNFCILDLRLLRRPRVHRIPHPVQKTHLAVKRTRKTRNRNHHQKEEGQRK